MDVTVRNAVASAFYSIDEVESAIQDLHQAGFTEDEIGIAIKEESEYMDREWVRQLQQETVEGATAGAVGGGVIGGLIGAGLAIAIPGVGAAVGAGIMAVLAASGAFGGGLFGALTGMGIDEDEAQYLDRQFQKGALILTVSTPDPERRDQARDILRRNNRRAQEPS